MKKLRLAVLGTGMIVRRAHLPALLGDARVDVAAIYGRNKKTASELAAEFGIPAIAETIEDAVNIDASMPWPSPCRISCIAMRPNYLLLDRAPWSGLARLFDLTVFLTAPRAEFERRLLKRWTDLSYPDEYAVAKVRGNDMPNVDLVLEHSMPADVTWESG